MFKSAISDSEHVRDSSDYFQNGSEHMQFHDERPTETLFSRGVSPSHE